MTAPWWRRLIAVSLIAGLAACGGGGGGGEGDDEVADEAPAVVVCNDAAPAGTAPAFNGMQTVAICPNVFVDPSIATSEHAQISALIQRAVERDREYFGTLVASPPDIIACRSTECGTYFAGPSLRNTSLPPNSHAGTYVAPRATIVLTGLAADTEDVLTHEGAHVELAARIGSGSVPAWFNEGLATVVGGAPNCDGVSSKLFADLRQADDQPTWNAQTNSTATFRPGYCQARAEVSAWIDAHSAGAVISLLTAVKNGTPFYDAYGSFLTQ